MGRSEDNLVRRHGGRLGLTVKRRWLLGGAKATGLIGSTPVELISETEAPRSTIRADGGMSHQSTASGPLKQWVVARTKHRRLASGRVLIERRRPGQAVNIHGRPVDTPDRLAFGEAFDGAFEVTASNHDAVRTILTPELCETLVAFFEVAPNAVITATSTEMRIGGKGSRATAGTNVERLVRNMARMSAELDEAAA